MRVAIVGAGVAGLTTAKVLVQAGHDVQVFDRTPDVGGVWSRTRRYPGLTTQSPKAQYSFSDFPMPKHFPEWPTGAQVQEYLESYSAAFGLDACLWLETTVESVVPDGDKWRVIARSAAETIEATYDRVVVANGVFCEPALPRYPGRAEFKAEGGELVAGSDFHDVEEARGKHVLVVGYGKSACDVTVPISQVAASTDVIARQMLWKVPRKVAGVLNFKMLLLTRMGEALFRYRHLRGFEKFLHGPGNRMRRSMLNSVGSVSVRQFKLKQHDLVPPGRMEDIVKGAIGLATEGFFEGVADGSIRVRRDMTIRRLLVVDGQPSAELADGTVLPADLIVCATGFTQDVPFLDEAVRRRLFDERGNFMLYRQIQPIDVPGLYFNGYNSSFFSPLNAEMAALWIAADLAGALTLPDAATRRADVVGQLAFMDDATGTHHCRGTKIIPFSMHNADEVLGDLGMQIGRFTRAGHWLNPVSPKAYRKLTPALLARLAATPAQPETAAPTSVAT
ncbi:flavin-containing monooxygenase [Kibdelosporangium aridum]|uniref:Predicted flavoprotein CzcO associated with the cation diffusion facilitator CzcD n=1 Tax=Kibdelosporangium aridum TaxID=2030 RepID=A0A1Y5Y2T4_KIBAR|nr:NAD(P)/FAD-dependent oxidoreductase [Kibdelosporangium aridum]SMD22900.1 Predicted flavoprotein CzcO associated with the cation diffusion facilitator CzcD [Kibdelosporangium aridum]